MELFRERWRNADEATKEKYQKKRLELQEVYKKELEEYERVHGKIKRGYPYPYPQKASEKKS